MKRGVLLVATCVVIGGILLGANHFLGGYSHSYGKRLPYDIQYLGEKIEFYRADSGAYLSSLNQLANVRPPVSNSMLGPYVKQSALRDPWRRAYYYRVDDEGKRFSLFSLGADGVIGGYGEDQDVQFNPRPNES